MAQDDCGLSESLEDYLEVILALEKANKVARAKDIADKMGVLRGSVSGALKTLSEKGLVNYAPYSFITLTPGGMKVAREVTRRHRVIRDFLERALQLSPERAEANACRMEHAMDKPSVDRLARFIDYINRCPRTGPDWINAFVNYYQADGPDARRCEQCLRQCQSEFPDRLAALSGRSDDDAGEGG